jgi:hypothetical protein
MPLSQEKAGEIMTSTSDLKAEIAKLEEAKKENGLSEIGYGSLSELKRWLSDKEQMENQIEDMKYITNENSKTFNYIINEKNDKIRSLEADKEQMKKRLEDKYVKTGLAFLKETEIPIKRIAELKNKIKALEAERERTIKEKASDIKTLNEQAGKETKLIHKFYKNKIAEREKDINKRFDKLKKWGERTISKYLGADEALRIIRKHYREYSDHKIDSFGAMNRMIDDIEKRKRETKP